MSAAHFSGQWLPWFHGDFIKATQGWTLLERGAYFMLLGASWEMGPLPNDRRRLAGIITAQLDEFDALWKVVGRKFEETEQGLVNRRLERIRDRQAERSEKASRSARARWSGNHVSTSSHANASANGYANASANGYAKGDAPAMLLDPDLNPDLRTKNIEPRRRRANARAAAEPPLHQQIRDAYNRLCPDLPSIRTWPKHRRAALEERIRERCADGKPADTVEYWERFFEAVAASDFLCGRTSNPFTGCSIDWLLAPKNFPKVIEGNYRNRATTNGARAHG